LTSTRHALEIVPKSPISRPSTELISSPRCSPVIRYICVVLLECRIAVATSLEQIHLASLVVAVTTTTVSTSRMARSTQCNTRMICNALSVSNFNQTPTIRGPYSFLARRCLAMEIVLPSTPTSMDITLGPSCVHHKNFATSLILRENAETTLSMEATTYKLVAVECTTIAI
jgi:hypothetical protein